MNFVLTVLSYQGDGHRQQSASGRNATLFFQLLVIHTHTVIATTVATVSSSYTVSGSN